MNLFFNDLQFGNSNSTFFNYPNNFDFLYEIIGSPYQEPAHDESECVTLLYCFATYLDYVMRFDGGIAVCMQAASFAL